MESDPSNKNLLIYYCMDFALDTVDKCTIIKCLEVYIKVKKKQYNTVKLEEFDSQSIKYNNEFDAIQRGLQTFTTMYDKLKLKSTCETWFVYITSNKIRAIPKQVGVILLNTDINNSKCFYSINKNNAFVIDKHDTRTIKLEKVRELTKSLDDLMTLRNKINYSKFQVNKMLAP